MDREVLLDDALRYFLEVVRTGSVSEAANQLGVAPSAVSRQIARLEKSLDTLLFERKARGMSPNAAGEVLARYAKQVHRAADSVAEDILALRGLKQGMVRIVGALGFGLDLIPKLVTQFQRRHEGIRFSLEICSQEKVSEYIRNGDADLGITLSMSSQRDIKVELRRPDPIRAIMVPGHALSQKRKVSLSEVLTYPVGVHNPESTTRQLIEISLSRQQLGYKPAFTSRSFEALVGFAKEGGGVIFAGELAVRGLIENSQLVAIPLTDREMNERHFEVQTLAGRRQSTACAAFISSIATSLMVPSR